MFTSQIAYRRLIKSLVRVQRTSAGPRVTHETDFFVDLFLFFLFTFSTLNFEPFKGAQTLFFFSWNDHSKKIALENGSVFLIGKYFSFFCSFSPHCHSCQTCLPLSLLENTSKDAISSNKPLLRPLIASCPLLGPKIYLDRRLLSLLKFYLLVSSIGVNPLLILPLLLRLLFRPL